MMHFLHATYVVIRDIFAIVGVIAFLAALGIDRGHQ